MATIRRLPHLVPNVITDLRLTIPAREALERAGNPVAPAGTLTAPARWTPPHPDRVDVLPYPTYAVELIAPPRGLVLVCIGHREAQHYGVRCDNEPPYPGEWPDQQGVAWWERGNWTPCPTCGAALLWCEAGFVPGWRICLSGHASQLSSDGRSAKRHAKQDASTLRTTRPL